MTKMLRCALAMVLTMGCPLACLRPAEERARRDAEVGNFTAGDVEFRVHEGLATARKIAPGAIELWAGAPAIILDARAAAGAMRHWRLAVDNLPSDTELVVNGIRHAGESVPGDPVTRRRWSIEITPGETRWDLEPPDAASRERWSFAVLSDIQGAVDRVQDLFDRINQEPDVRFVVSAGDLTQHGSDAQLGRYQAELLRLERPFYTTLGNHEVGTSNDAPPFSNWFGRGSSHFEFHDVAFSFLDSASATFDATVSSWLAAWLARSQEQVHVVVTHFPLIDPIGVRNGSWADRNEAYQTLGRLAQGRVDLCLYGHIHSYYEFENAGIMARISGGGGALPERFDNIGRHFVVVTVDPALGRVMETRVVSVP